jgi:hypothetical protein
LRFDDNIQAMIFIDFFSIFLAPSEPSNIFLTIFALVCANVPLATALFDIVKISIDSYSFIYCVFQSSEFFI